MIQVLSPQHWKEYELLDCGNLEKLERFGRFVLRRPEPQALWQKRWTEKKWKELTDIRFEQTGSHKGKWIPFSEKDLNWRINYKHKDLKISFELFLSQFKHVGIFPEQAANWDFIYENLKKLPQKTPKTLNLFAYTGGASLAAKAAGADVYHVDSVKQVVSKARKNMEFSQLKDIRWVVEDAVKFVEREARRGNKYQCILLDPPAYGIGAKGERWQLEEKLDYLLEKLSEIADNQNFVFLLNVYSLGLSTLILQNMIHDHFKVDQMEMGELALKSTSGVFLPLGTYTRFAKV